MKNKNKILALLGVIFLVALVFILIRALQNDRVFDIKSLEEFFTKGYVEENLDVMDFMEVRELFGIDVNDYEESMFLTNMTIDKENKDDILVILIKSTNDETFEILNSFIESQKMYLEDKELLEIYDKAIVKKEGNYSYLILAPDSALIERELYAYYK